MDVRVCSRVFPSVRVWYAWGMTGVRFVEKVPEPLNRYDHRAIAEVLRSRPGEWGVVDLPTYYAPNIRRALVKSYGPPGSFEARVRGDRLMVRFVGDPSMPIPAGEGEGRRYDHEDARRRARAAAAAQSGGSIMLPDWPQSYVSLIKKGRLGYTPAGAWTASYVKDFGLALGYVGNEEGKDEDA